MSIVSAPSSAKGKVSIVIPCYNSGPMLLETLASVEKVRSDSVADVVIVDDGSSEPATCRILQDLDTDKYEVLHQPNQGPGSARNAGIRIAAGEFILPLDSDNRIREAYLDHGVGILLQNPDVGVVYGDAEYFGDQTGRWRVAEFDCRSLVIQNYIDNCALYRKSAWESVGGYDENRVVMGWEDWDHWMRIALRGWKFVHIDEVAFDYRVREGSLLSEVRGNFAEATAYIFEKPGYLVLNELRNQGLELFRLKYSRDYKVGCSIVGPLRSMKRSLLRTSDRRMRDAGVSSADRSSKRLEREAGWHIPRAFKRNLPGPILDGLREIKGRIVTRNFSRHKRFEQSKEDAQASESMSIVVPVHDAPKVTGRCLASLEKFAPLAEVIIVDDGSALNETIDLLDDFVRRNAWKMVRQTNALGHSLACGAGTRQATRPYLCLLNSDTVVTPWCWRLIKGAFECDRQIAVAGPSTSRSGNEQTLSQAEQLREYLNDSQICAVGSRILGEYPTPATLDLQWASGFAFFIRRKLWEQFGGFDPNLADYGNEVELCTRVRALGYRVVWVRNSYIHHFGAASYINEIGIETIIGRIRGAERYIEQKHRASSL